MFILKRYIKFYKSNGLYQSFLKFFLSPYRMLRKLNYNKKKNEIFSLVTEEERFKLIYKYNFWSSKESVSGLGSELKNTVNIRKKLPKIFDDFKINKILDAPCGDFNWVSLILSNKIDYIGGDIVNDLIKKNNLKYKKKNINFINLDITSDALPDADLMICRDCLIHFSFKNIKRFFYNFKKSKIKYLLLTSYKLKKNESNFNNIDIKNGDFREIDLSQPPFSLSEPILKILDKDKQGEKSGFHCYLNMYRHDQIN